MEQEPEAMDPAAGLVGPGCADYAEQVPDGAGSVEGMAADPVAVAASNNPLLTTLTAAVSGELNPNVDLVDTLNGDEFTVFAPVDDAFAELPEKTVNALAQPDDADMLTTILTYHVVPGQLSPDEIAGTTQTTVQGGDVEVTGSGDDLKVNDAQRHLRRRADRQRHGLPHRRGADAADVTSPTYARAPSSAPTSRADRWGGWERWPRPWWSGPSRRRRALRVKRVRRRA